MNAKVKDVRALGLVKTAVLTGQFNGKAIELGATTTNTTYTQVIAWNGGKPLTKGAEIEIDDTYIKESVVDGKATGRYFIDRATADTYLKAVKMAEAEQRLQALQA